MFGKHFEFGMYHESGDSQNYNVETVKSFLFKVKLVCVKITTENLNLLVLWMTIKLITVCILSTLNSGHEVAPLH